MRKLIVISLVIFLTGCNSLGQVVNNSITSALKFMTGTATVHARHTEPAEYDFSRYSAVVVKEITVSSSQGYQVLEGKLRNALQEELFTSKYFETFSSDKGVGKNYFVISADVTKSDFSEDYSSGEGWCSGKKCYLYKTYAKWNANVLVRAYDARTGKLLWRKKVSGEESASEMQQGGYVKFDRYAGFNKVMADISKEIHSSLQPVVTEVKAELYINEKVPGMVEGIKSAESGDWEKSAESFKKAVGIAESGKLPAEESSQTYFNYGIVLAYGLNNYEAGMEMLERAIKLEKDSDYVEALSDINKLKSDSEKLAKQGYKL